MQQDSAASLALQTEPHRASAAADAADDLRQLLRSWQWKREHRPDKDRFQRPYQHTMMALVAPAAARPSSPDQQHQGQQHQGQQHQEQEQEQQVTLVIKQQRFATEGFASTVWDSSIVVAKYLERLGPAALAGRRCLDLSAGCGLVGVVMAKLGASQVAVTDLAPNLPLLAHNCSTNGVPRVVVAEHRWGDLSSAAALSPPFELIAACDVLYVHELVPPLLASLLALSGPDTTILVAHGRNRPAEPAFRQAAAKAGLTIELVRPQELDGVYRCSDVDVLRLRRQG